MRRLGCVLMIGLLWAGGQGVYEALRYGTPQTLSCSEVQARPPASVWVHLTGCQVNLLEAARKTRLGVPTDDIYIPLRPRTGNGAGTIRVVLATRDPEVVGLVEQMTALEAGDRKAAFSFLARNARQLVRDRDVTGMLQSGIDKDDKLHRRLRELNKELADDFVVLDEGRRPNATGSVLALVAGAVLLLVFVGGALRRSGEAPACASAKTVAAERPSLFDGRTRPANYSGPPERLSRVGSSLQLRPAHASDGPLPAPGPAVTTASSLTGGPIAVASPVSAAVADANGVAVAPSEEHQAPARPGPAAGAAASAAATTTVTMASTSLAGVRAHPALRAARSSEAAGTAPRSLVKNVKSVATLLIVQGLLEAIPAGILTALAFAGVFGVAQGSESQRSFLPPESVLLVLLVGPLVVLGGFLKILAGRRNLRLRDRTMGLMALGSSVLAVPTCICAPTACALAVYGFVVYLNAGVRDEFARAESSSAARPSPDRPPRPGARHARR